MRTFLQFSFFRIFVEIQEEKNGALFWGVFEPKHTIYSTVKYNLFLNNRYLPRSVKHKKHDVSIMCVTREILILKRWRFLKRCHTYVPPCMSIFNLQKSEKLIYKMFWCILLLLPLAPLQNNLFILLVRIENVFKMR